MTSLKERVQGALRAFGSEDNDGDEDATSDPSVNHSLLRDFAPSVLLTVFAVAWLVVLAGDAELRPRDWERTGPSNWRVDYLEPFLQGLPLAHELWVFLRDPWFPLFCALSFRLVLVMLLPVGKDLISIFAKAFARRAASARWCAVRSIADTIVAPVSGWIVESALTPLLLTAAILQHETVVEVLPSPFAVVAVWWLEVGVRYNKRGLCLASTCVLLLSLVVTVAQGLHGKTLPDVVHRFATPLWEALSMTTPTTPAAVPPDWVSEAAVPASLLLVAGLTAVLHATERAVSFHLRVLKPARAQRALIALGPLPLWVLATALKVSLWWLWRVTSMASLGICFFQWKFFRQVRTVIPTVLFAVVEAGGVMITQVRARQAEFELNTRRVLRGVDALRPLSAQWVDREDLRVGDCVALFPGDDAPGTVVILSPLVEVRRDGPQCGECRAPAVAYDVAPHIRELFTAQAPPTSPCGMMSREGVSSDTYLSGGATDAVDTDAMPHNNACRNNAVGAGPWGSAPFHPESGPLSPVFALNAGANARYAPRQSMDHPAPAGHTTDNVGGMTAGVVGGNTDGLRNIFSPAFPTESHSGSAWRVGQGQGTDVVGGSRARTRLPTAIGNRRRSSVVSSPALPSAGTATPVGQAGDGAGFDDVGDAPAVLGLSFVVNTATIDGETADKKRVFSFPTFPLQCPHFEHCAAAPAGRAGALSGTPLNPPFSPSIPAAALVKTAIPTQPCPSTSQAASSETPAPAAAAMQRGPLGESAADVVMGESPPSEIHAETGDSPRTVHTVPPRVWAPMGVQDGRAGAAPAGDPAQTVDEDMMGTPPDSIVNAINDALSVGANAGRAVAALPEIALDASGRAGFGVADKHLGRDPRVVRHGAVVGRRTPWPVWALIIGFNGAAPPAVRAGAVDVYIDSLSRLHTALLLTYTSMSLVAALVVAGPRIITFRLVLELALANNVCLLMTGVAIASTVLRLLNQPTGALKIGNAGKRAIIALAERVAEARLRAVASNSTDQCGTPGGRCAMDTSAAGTHSISNTSSRAVAPVGSGVFNGGRPFFPPPAVWTRVLRAVRMQWSLRRRSMYTVDGGSRPTSPQSPTQTGALRSPLSSPSAVGTGGLGVARGPPTPTGASSIPGSMDTGGSTIAGAGGMLPWPLRQWASSRTGFGSFRSASASGGLSSWRGPSGVLGGSVPTVLGIHLTDKTGTITANQMALQGTVPPIVVDLGDHHRLSHVRSAADPPADDMASTANNSFVTSAESAPVLGRTEGGVKTAGSADVAAAAATAFHGVPSRTTGAAGAASADAVRPRVAGPEARLSRRAAVLRDHISPASGITATIGGCSPSPGGSSSASEWGRNGGGAYGSLGGSVGTSGAAALSPIVGEVRVPEGAHSLSGAFTGTRQGRAGVASPEARPPSPRTAAALRNFLRPDAAGRDHHLVTQLHVAVTTNTPTAPRLVPEEAAYSAGLGVGLIDVGPVPTALAWDRMSYEWHGARQPDIVRLHLGLSARFKGVAAIVRGPFHDIPAGAFGLVVQCAPETLAGNDICPGTSAVVGCVDEVAPGVGWSSIRTEAGSHGAAAPGDAWGTLSFQGSASGRSLSASSPAVCGRHPSAPSTRPAATVSPMPEEALRCTQDSIVADGSSVLPAESQLSSASQSLLPEGPTVPPHVPSASASASAPPVPPQASAVLPTAHAVGSVHREQTFTPHLRPSGGVATAPSRSPAMAVDAPGSMPAVVAATDDFSTTLRCIPPVRFAELQHTHRFCRDKGAQRNWVLAVSAKPLTLDEVVTAERAAAGLRVGNPDAERKRDELLQRTPLRAIRQMILVDLYRPAVERAPAALATGGMAFWMVTGDGRANAAAIAAALGLPSMGVAAPPVPQELVTAAAAPPRPAAPLSRAARRLDAAAQASVLPEPSRPSRCNVPRSSSFRSASICAAGTRTKCGSKVLRLAPNPRCDSFATMPPRCGSAMDGSLISATRPSLGSTVSWRSWSPSPTQQTANEASGLSADAKGGRRRHGRSNLGPGGVSFAENTTPHAPGAAAASLTRSASAGPVALTSGGNEGSMMPAPTTSQSQRSELPPVSSATAGTSKLPSARISSALPTTVVSRGASAGRISAAPPLMKQFASDVLNVPAGGDSGTDVPASPNDDEHLPSVELVEWGLELARRLADAGRCTLFLGLPEQIALCDLGSSSPPSLVSSLTAADAAGPLVQVVCFSSERDLKGRLVRFCDVVLKVGTVFTGDGKNDVDALAAAHVGVALPGVMTADGGYIHDPEVALAAPVRSSERFWETYVGQGSPTPLLLWGAQLREQLWIATVMLIAKQSGTAGINSAAAGATSFQRNGDPYHPALYFFLSNVLAFALIVVVASLVYRHRPLADVQEGTLRLDMRAGVLGSIVAWLGGIAWCTFAVMVVPLSWAADLAYCGLLVTVTCVGMGHAYRWRQSLTARSVAFWRVVRNITIGPPQKADAKRA
eukprot:TRINITY_DN56403_c0_g1_i1.p1 TRINITY_DN56403_c0_g1~~TRINITY_DN56403_c0_g1_i1.p1  ORF type:complete len:2466 (+),score=211.23 TRINITY_DN56403_c0_g1_i1:126-7523(+)